MQVKPGRQTFSQNKINASLDRCYNFSSLTSLRLPIYEPAAIQMIAIKASLLESDTAADVSTRHLRTHAVSSIRRVVRLIVSAGILLRASAVEYLHLMKFLFRYRKWPTAVLTGPEASAKVALSLTDLLSIIR